CPSEWRAKPLSLLDLSPERSAAPIMRAVDAVMECLKNEGVDTVFGIPGYAKASGRVGVAMATSGPGATNLVTAIADAVMDSVPTVFITGQVRTDLIGTDGFQEADVTGITMPIVKHSLMIQDPRDIPAAIHEAFHIARTGRPGPVLIDVPQDLSRADIPYEPVDTVHLPGYQPTPEDQWLGMLGMHGTRAANYSMDEADLIVAIGARFDDRITGKLSEFAPRAKFIHIDVDPAEISKNVPAHIPIVGDAKNILPRLTAEYRALAPEPARLEDWWARIEDWRRRHPLRYDDTTDAEIRPQRMIEALYEATDGGECILSSDVGQHQMWAAQYFHFSKPRRWINSGGLGTMGFGLPAAMGAAVARPDVPSVLISGDASIQMNCQELATCATYGIP